MVLDNKLLVTELLERIKFYKDKADNWQRHSKQWECAYQDIKAEYDFFREEMLREQEPMISEPPYYDTADIADKVSKAFTEACPTLDNLVDLENKLKQADTIGC